MSKLVSNYSSNGSSTTDEYGTFIGFNRFVQGDVIEGFQVVANGTPNMTVLVQPGSGRVTTGTYPASYGYLISHDTALPGESVTIATAAASPRIDYVLAYIDKSVAGSTSGGNVNNTNNVLKFASVAGTPSGSPVVPTLSQIQTAIGPANPYIILAQVAVGASVSTITNPNITDLRVFATSRNALALGSSSYVDNGCVWTISSGLAGTMTKGLVYINVNGVMVPVNLAAIASNTFTASQDTYVYVNVLGTVGYLPVANNAASPALPANAVWLAIVVTSGSAITSINTGQIGATAPTVSGRVLMVSDTNGVLIYPTANQRTLAHAQITSDSTTVSLAPVTGLSITFLAVAGRKYTVSAYSADLSSSTGATIAKATLWNGAVSSGTQVQMAQQTSGGANYGTPMNMAYKFTATATGSISFNLGLQDIGGSTAKIQAGATYPAALTAENA
ncbi:hypothetical protein AB4Y95_00105 [Arthrobacter sp. M-10]|uniref:hypothetical protein n=1 Tax=Arthrobacter sp. M-10 TaxID=3233037 RepID=UPI003F8FF9CF